MTQVEIARPDDWHVHLRDGAQLTRTVADLAKHFARAIVMPNLPDPVVNVDGARAYRQRILDVGQAGFTPLMTLYLTDATTVEVIDAAHASGLVHAVKLYPAGATTNSARGVTDISRVEAALERMAARKMPLLVHAEVTRPEVDVFARERVFLDELLGPLVDRHPSLPVVLEHVTTAEGVRFVENAREGVAATITAHHLLLNRNDLLVGGLKPHHYCLPVLKAEEHRVALVEAATSGNPRFFLGTDSAPHAREDKECASGCAGCYTAPYAMALYAEAFDDAGALDRLEGFASHFGADFYGLPRNTETLVLVKEAQPVPETLDFGGRELVPLRAGASIAWSVRDAAS